MNKFVYEDPRMEVIVLEEKDVVTQLSISTKPADEGINWDDIINKK